MLNIVYAAGCGEYDGKSAKIGLEQIRPAVIVGYGT